MHQTVVVRYFLLNKRLFKKISFIVILCIVPFLVVGMKLASKQESGIFKIALFLPNSDDELSSEIVTNLIESDSVMQYVICKTEQEATDMVRSFEADEAWIFPENLEKSLQEIASEKRLAPVVTIIARQETISLVFTREILCNSLYPAFSYAVYQDFVRDDLGLEMISDQELKDAYNQTLVKGNLFQMAYLDGQEVETNNYLLAPIRGILAVWLVLCGFAASMYFIQDEQSGTFSCVPLKDRLKMAFGVHAVLIADSVVVLLIACKFAGIFTNWYSETLCAVLFAICTIAFCNFIRLLCGTIERLGAFIPVLLIAMIILCPVFINIKNCKLVQYLLPPYYYLKSIHSVYYLYEMMIYAVIGIILCIFLSKWQNKTKLNKLS